MRSFIIADDLTGACDSAAPFAVGENRVWVTWKLGKANRLDAGTISICTASRDDQPEIAAEKVRRAGSTLPTAAATVFKKIDSTLRGNWVIETQALMRSLGSNMVILAPAFPAMRRIVVNGKLRTTDRAEYTGDEMTSILYEMCDTDVVHIPLSELRKGSAHLVALARATAKKKSVMVVDGESDADLDIVAAAMEVLGTAVLPVGSGGLAAAMARRPRDIQRSSQVSNESDSSSDIGKHAVANSAICLVGSTNPQTESQVECLIESGNTQELVLAEYRPSQLHEYLRAGTNLIVRVVWDHRAGNAIRQLLAEISEIPLVSFVLTGGDTAQAFCDCSDADGIWVRGEVSCGMPWGKLAGGAADGTVVVTKAGGFGDRYSLLRAVNFLTRGNARSETIC